MPKRRPIKRTVLFALVLPLWLASFNGYVGYAWAKLDVHIFAGTAYWAYWHYPDLPAKKILGLHWGAAGVPLEQFNEALPEGAFPLRPLLVLVLLWTVWGWVPVASSALTQSAEMRCRACGYSLQYLPSSVCPECGTAFDPGYARSYRSGSTPWWAQLGLVSGCSAVALLGIVAVTIMRTGRNPVESGTLLAIFGVALLGAALAKGKSRSAGGLLLILIALLFALLAMLPTLS